MMESTVGGQNPMMNFLIILILLYPATPVTSSAKDTLSIADMNCMDIWIKIGVLANEHVAPSLAFVYAWQVAPLHTRHFFNRQSLYHLLKQSLWLLLSILYDLDIPDYAATHQYDDTGACTAMANAGKPTTRTRHMDIQYNDVWEWVERDLVVLERKTLQITSQRTYHKYCSIDT
jgi:hypothetical protein